jgi:DNA-binding CsgD family transcriptional regulator
MEKPIKLLLAGPPALCACLRERLEGDSRFRLLPRPAGTRLDLVGQCANFEPTILLADFDLLSGDVLADLKGLLTPPAIVGLSPHHSPGLEEMGRSPLVQGTLLYPHIFTPVLNEVLAGIGTGFSYHVPGDSQGLACGLSAYQSQLLQLMALGLDNRRLSAVLGRSHHSIYLTQFQVRRKLGVETNAQAILAAVQEGLAGLFEKPPSESVQERG